jgi:hypothetical protein
MGNDKGPDNTDDTSEKIIEDLNELIEEAKKPPLDDPIGLPQGGPGPGH